MLELARRAQFAGILHSYGPHFMDPRGRPLARAFDVLGYIISVHILAHDLMSTMWCINYTINLLQVCMLPLFFQKPDPDITPPVFTPLLPDGYQMYEEASIS